jgi:hypothetical protein
MRCSSVLRTQDAQNDSRAGDVARDKGGGAHGKALGGTFLYVEARQTER